MIFESLGPVCAVQFMRHPWKQFVDDFLVPRGCLHCPMKMHWATVKRILHYLKHTISHASPVEAVLLMIFEMAVTQFLSMILEATGAVCAVESLRHQWKQFR